MALLRTGPPFETRYLDGGDEFIVAEFDIAMSLEVNMRMQAVARKVLSLAAPGIIDVAPANITLLIRFDPDLISHAAVVQLLRDCEADLRTSTTSGFPTRVIDVPVYFQDPWTLEVQMKYRDRVQEPGLTDIEYLAKTNGLPSAEAVVERIAGSPWMTTLTGFSPGGMWVFQMVPRARQLQAPKYLSPRPETPVGSFGLGGAFAGVYSVASAGGYPIIGRAPVTAYDPQQRLPDFKDHFALGAVGYIYFFRPIEATEYARITDEVEEGTFRFRKADIDFEPATCFAAPVEVARDIKEALYS